MASASTISVIIPAYEPDELLVQTIQSVLSVAHQVTQPELAINVTVVDDESPSVNVAAIVAQADPEGRVELVQNDCQLGLAGNWNRVISLAKGDFIHLLHQDDYVPPNFYQRLYAGFQQRPDIGMVFFRTRIVDRGNRTLKTSSRASWFRGVLSNWLWQLGESQRVQTPAVIVARSTYEKVGGLGEVLCDTLDWEMWVRIAARFPVWYDPSVLTAYRRHTSNESSRLLHNGAVWPDLARAITLNAGYFPTDIRDRLTARSARWYLRSAFRTVTKQIQSGDFSGAEVTLQHLSCLLDVLPKTELSVGLERRKNSFHRRLERLRATAA